MSIENSPFQEIKKRDGRVTAFDKRKITEAIFKAASAVGGENYALAEELTDEVVSYLAVNNISGLMPTVEEIQDAVEKTLIERGHARTSKAYILYRDKRTRIREAKSELMDVVEDILVEGRRGSEEGGSSPAQKMQEIALAASQKYYLDNLLPPDIAEAHRRGSFHIHSLGYYSKTFDSLHLNLPWMLNSNPGLLEKASSFSFFSTLMNIAGWIQRIGGDMYGEQNLPFFDRFLAEFCPDPESRAGRAELAGGLKGFLRCFQGLPRYGEGAPGYGGGGLGFGLGNGIGLGLGLDLSAEGRECARFLLNEVLSGKDNYNAHNMPGIVFSLMEGVNLLPQDPNYDLFLLALSAALRRGNPSFCFLNTTYNNDTDGVCYFPGGLRIGENKHSQGGGEGRGNICSLTINLPRLALATRDEELFFVELDRLLYLGVRQLLHRFEVLTALRCRDLPFVMGKGQYMGSNRLSPDASIHGALKNGVMTLGFVGLPEVIRLLLPEEKESDEGAQRLALRILNHMSRRVLSFREEFDLNFALASLDRERELRRFIERDREDFGLIRGVTDKELYSSGFLLFSEDEGLERKIALEGELHKHCSAGCSSKLFLMPGSDLEGAAEFLRVLASADLGFVTVNPFFSSDR